MKCLVVFISLYFAFVSFGQEIVYQTPFEDGIASIIVSPDQQYYISTEGDIQTFGGLTIKLWDFKSKLLIKKKWFESENGPGSGQIELLDDGVLFVSLNHAIIQVDLFKNSVDTLFRVAYPEYIHHYASINSDQLVIATKSYDDNNELINDITNLGTLYSCYLKSEGETLKKTFKSEFTCLSTVEDQGYFLAGVNSGDCFFLNSRLENIREPINLYKKSAPRFLAISKDSILISNAAIGEKNYINLVGLPLINFYDLKADQQLPSLKIAETGVPDNFDSPFEMLPSNNVKEIIFNKQSSNLFISFGYSSILKFDLSDSTKKIYDLIASTETIHSLISTPEENKFFVVHGKATIFENYNQFSIIDLKQEKMLRTIKNKKLALSIESEFCQIEGNYYLITKTNIDEYKFIDQDTLLIRNQSLKSKTVVVCKECKIEIGKSNSTWLISNDYEGLIAVKPKLKALNQDTLFLSLEREDWLSEIKISNSKDFIILSTIDFKADIFDKKRFGQELEYVEKHNCNVVILEKGKYDKPKKSVAILLESGEMVKEVSIANLSTIDVEVSLNNNTIVVSEYEWKKTTRFHIYTNVNETWSLNTIDIITNGMTSMQISKDGKQLIIQRSLSDEEVDFELVQFDLPDFSNERIIHSKLYYQTFFLDSDRNQLFNFDGDYLYRINLSSNQIDDKIEATNSTGIIYYPTLNQVMFTFKKKNVQFKLKESYYIQSYMFEKYELLLSDNNGYYLSQGNQQKNFGFVLNGRGYPFSQFDLKYNRPDMIIDGLGIAGVDEVDSYRKAYQKRLQKMKFTEEMMTKPVHTPIINIMGNSTNSFERASDRISIEVNTSDTKYPLDRINVWINNIPIYGINGISLRSKMTQDFDTTIQLQLSAGENKIEISVLNQAGAESYKETVYINCTKPSPKPNLHLIVLSVSEYEDANFNLRYAVKDGQDIVNLFKSNSQGLYGKVVIDTLYNKQVTLENIQKIKQGLEQASINDQVIFYISGHGVLDDNYDFYYASYDMDFEDASKRGISYDLLENLLDSIPPRKKLLLMDACHGGEVDKDDLTVVKDSTVLANNGQKGNVIKYSYRGVVMEDEETENSESGLSPFEIMQETFVNLDRRNGATVISASAGESFAYESDKWNNGVFTYSILNGLKNKEADLNGDGKITLEELKEYVSEEVILQTEGQQKPNTRHENAEYDYRVW